MRGTEPLALDEAVSLASPEQDGEEMPEREPPAALRRLQYSNAQAGGLSEKEPHGPAEELGMQMRSGCHV